MNRVHHTGRAYPVEQRLGLLVGEAVVDQVDEAIRLEGLDNLASSIMLFLGRAVAELGEVKDGQGRLWYGDARHDVIESGN